MVMGIPFFLLFAVYGVVSAYLPILLFRLGYSATMIGILQGIFEASGLIFPIFVSSRVDKKGTYGLAMIFLGLLMAAVLLPLVYIHNFWVTAAVLSLFAIGFKGAAPVADGLVTRLLGTGNTNYGRVRVMGSIGFVCITLLLQFFPLLDADSPFSIAFWIGLPALLFSASVLVIPGLLKKYPPAVHPVPLNLSSEFPRSFWIGILLIFLGFLGLTPSLRFFSLYIHEYLHLESYAGLWALAAACEVPFMFFSGKFIRRFGSEKLIMLALTAIAVRNLIYAIFPGFWGAVVGQLFHSICFGLFHPAAVNFVCKRSPKRLMVVGLTLYSSVSVGLAAVFGNILGGIIIDSFGYRVLFTFFSIFPLAGMLIFYCLRERIYRDDV